MLESQALGNWDGPRLTAFRIRLGNLKRKLEKKKTTKVREFSLKTEDKKPSKIINIINGWQK